MGLLACNLKGRQGWLENLPKVCIKYIKMENVILVLLHFCRAGLNGAWRIGAVCFQLQ